MLEQGCRRIGDRWRKVLLYDKSGEEHFNLISALHKSIRSSDPDAARKSIRLARMLEGVVKTRLLYRAPTGPTAWRSKTSAWPIPKRWNKPSPRSRPRTSWASPEGDLALAQVRPLLSGGRAAIGRGLPSPLGAAMETVEKSPAEPVPMQLRNAPTRAMKQWGYGAGYQHAHQFEDAINTMECLPESLRGTRFYEPTDRGVEQRIAARLEELRQKKSE